MPPKIFFSIIALFVAFPGLAQKDSTKIKRFEAGLMYFKEYRSGYYHAETNTAMSPAPYTMLWKYSITGWQHEKNVLSSYFKYTFHRFSSVETGLNYCDFSLRARSKISVSDSIYTHHLSYRIKSIGLPVGITFNFYNKTFLVPYFIGMVNFNFSIYEKAEMWAPSYPIKTFTKDHFQYYCINFTYGLGADYTIKKTVNLGWRITWTTRQYAKSINLLAPLLQFSKLSFGVYAGYRF